MVGARLGMFRNPGKDSMTGKGAVRSLRDCSVTQPVSDSITRHETTGSSERVTVVAPADRPLMQMSGHTFDEGISFPQAARRATP